MPSGRHRLNRDAVLRAAQRIIDERGLDACTMRAVANELGVEAMSLYWHIPGKDALLDGVIELTLADIPPVEFADQDWEAVLRAAARSLRAAILEHRNLLPLMASRPLAGYAAAAGITEGVIRALEAAGFYRRTAIRAARTLSRYVMGFSIAEPAPGQAEPPPSGSPALDELMRSVTHDDPEELFAFGLEALLTGFRTWLGRPDLPA